MLFCGCQQATAKILSKASPRAIFKSTELDRTTQAIVVVNIMNERWRKLNANMLPIVCHSVPTCAYIAVCQLCREEQPVSGTVMMAWIWQVFGSMPWWSGVLFPWHKLLPRLAQNKCCKVYRQSEFDPWVYILVFGRRWLLQGCLGKPFPWK